MEAPPSRARGSGRWSRQRPADRCSAPSAPSSKASRMLPRETWALRDATRKATHVVIKFRILLAPKHAPGSSSPEISPYYPRALVLSSLQGRADPSWVGAPQSPASHSLPLEATRSHGAYGHQQEGDSTGLAVAEPLSGRRAAHPVGTQPETQLTWPRGQRSRASAAKKTRCPAQSHTQGPGLVWRGGPASRSEDDGPNL